MCTEVSTATMAYNGFYFFGVSWGDVILPPPLTPAHTVMDIVGVTIL